MTPRSGWRSESRDARQPVVTADQEEDSLDPVDGNERVPDFTCYEELEQYIKRPGAAKFLLKNGVHVTKLMNTLPRGQPWRTPPEKRSKKKDR